MTHQPHQPILDLMADGRARTSYEICDALYGPQPDGKRWYAVNVACDAMCAGSSARLVVVGKKQRWNEVGELWEGQTVYQIAPRLTTGV